MEIITKRWDPDRRDLELVLPTGSVLLEVRMSNTGDCQAAFAAKEGVMTKEPFPLAICTENTGVGLEGDPGDWRHVGTWTYPSGRVAHAFQPVPKPVKAAKKPSPKAAVASVDSKPAKK